MAEPDWLQMKLEYATTDLSLRALAEKYGVSRTTIGHRSKTEGWVEARRQHRIKLESKFSEKIANKEANKLAKLIATTDKAIDVVAKAFEDEQQFNRYLVETTEEYNAPEIVEEEDGDRHFISMRKWTHEEQFAKVDTKALRDLTAVLKDLTGLVRNLHGIPTQAEAESQRIAAERLDMDRKKAAVEDNSNKRIEIVFEAGEDAWNE